MILKKDCKSTCNKKTSIGGQALIEGIMMRGPKMTAMAVRNPNGEIVLEKWRNKASAKSKLKKLPLVRGVFGFIDSMTTGYKSLMRSAEISGLEEAEEELKREKEAKRAAKRAKKASAAIEEPSKEATIDANEVTESVTEEAQAEETKAAEAEISEKAEETKEEDNTAAAADTPVSEAEKAPAVEAKEEKKKKSSPLTSIVMIVSVVLALVISVVLFLYLPSQIYGWSAPLLPKTITESPMLNSLVKSAFEGSIRIVLLVGYMLCVSLMKDIRRTFMYHGAEHKTIFCYEHGQELTVENVRKEGRFHPRCGTSFLILMLIVGIAVSFCIDPLLILITGGDKILNSDNYMIIRTLAKLLTIPLIMGIGYELIKLAGRHDNIVTRIISAPGMWLQHITVLEPTDDMIECAILAFKEVLPDSEKEKYAECTESENQEKNETNNEPITDNTVSDKTENEEK